MFVVWNCLEWEGAWDEDWWTKRKTKAADTAAQVSAGGPGDLRLWGGFC